MVIVYVRTLDIPGFELVKINLSNYIEIDLLKGHFLAKVVVKELLFGWMKAEARRDLRLTVYRQVHILRHLPKLHSY